MPKGKFRKLTETEESYILNNWKEISLEEMGKKLEVTGGRIKRFLLKNNLDVEEILKERKKQNQFKKGLIPFNKGLKME